MPTATGTYATATALKQLIGTTDSGDDTLIGLICDRTNAMIERVTGRVLAPVSSATFTVDGNGRDKMYFPRGLRSVSLLECAASTGGSYSTVTAGTYFIRPSDYEREPGWPGFWLMLGETAAPRLFPTGYDTVRITATTGFAAIPDDVTDLALVVAQRAWNARQQGFQDVAGVDEMGRPVVTRFLSGRDRETLKQYTVPVLG